MKKPTISSHKKPSSSIRAKRGPGGDSHGNGTTPPGGNRRDRGASRGDPRRESGPRPKEWGLRARGGPGGNGQGGGTTPPHIRAIYRLPGGNGQEGGTLPPKTPEQLAELARLRQARRTPGSVYVSRDEVIEILDQKLGPLWAKNSDQIAFIGDTDYYCPPLDEVYRLIGKSGLGRRYYPEIFDCDDFSHALKGYFTAQAFVNGRKRPFSFAVGIVWLDKPFPHAMNWVISWAWGRREERTLYLVEPQSGLLYDIDAGTGQLRPIMLHFEQAEGKPGRRYHAALGEVVGKPHGDIYFTLI